MGAGLRVAWPHGAATLGHAWGWEQGLDQRAGCGYRGMCLRGLQGWLLLDIVLGAGFYLPYIPCCHLPRGNGCPQPSSVTCEAPEGWEGCGRMEILRALSGFCDIPMGNAPPQHGAGGWCDPPSLSHSSREGDFAGEGLAPSLPTL